MSRRNDPATAAFSTEGKTEQESEQKGSASPSPEKRRRQRRTSRDKSLKATPGLSSTTNLEMRRMDSEAKSPVPKVDFGESPSEASDSGTSRGAGTRPGRRRSSGAASDGEEGGMDHGVGQAVARKLRDLGYMRKPPLGQLKSRQSLRSRVAAEHTPEVHMLGELLGGTGFGSGVCCKFRVESGKHWTLLAGAEIGQTHVVYADTSVELASWNHPIDLHFATKSIQGWPRMMLQVWKLDEYGRISLQGYGFCHLPSAPGGAEIIRVPCWRPTVSMQEEISGFFLGVSPQLKNDEVLFNRAWEQRCRLVTVPAGTVLLQVSVLFRNMGDQHIDAAHC